MPPRAKCTKKTGLSGAGLCEDVDHAAVYPVLFTCSASQGSIKIPLVTVSGFRFLATTTKWTNQQFVLT